MPEFCYFLCKYYIIRIVIIRHYLLPNSKAKKHFKQKYQYVGDKALVKCTYMEIRMTIAIQQDRIEWLYGIEVECLRVW